MSMTDYGIKTFVKWVVVDDDNGTLIFKSILSKSTLVVHRLLCLIFLSRSPCERGHVMYWVVYRLSLFCLCQHARERVTYANLIGSIVPCADFTGYVVPNLNLE